MATPRKSEPDARIVVVARRLVDGPLKEEIRVASEDLAKSLGVAPMLAAAALADAIETHALRRLAEELVLDAEDVSAGPGVTSSRVQLASLLGTTRQGIERRYGAARKARRGIQTS